MQLSAATLLMRLCGSQPWWGQFLADMLSNLFSTTNSSLFPQDRFVFQLVDLVLQNLFGMLDSSIAIYICIFCFRVFIILAYLGRKSLTHPIARVPVLEAVLGMLGGLLQPLCNGMDGPLRSTADLSLVGWALLFVSQCLDIGSVSRDEDCFDRPLNKDQGKA